MDFREVSSTLTAKVRDINGNRVESAVRVVFELFNEPDEPWGCNINNHGKIDSTLTAQGVATATLNPGHRIMTHLLKAYTWRDERPQRHYLV